MSSGFNIDKAIEQLLRGEILPQSTVKEICERLKEQFVEESNVVPLKAPITIVGDLHGQFYDLLEIFKIGGKLPDSNYLFLGNYINRGYFSVETISLLVCLKLRYSSRITLLRGSHECRTLTQIYGFYGECMKKYGNVQVWKYFTNLFDYFPISALIDEQILAVHGGLSQSITTIDQIRVIDRFQEIPTEGSLTELVWADPDTEKEGFNLSPRGIGVTFGQDVFNKFLKVNKLDSLVRSNQLCLDGYQTIFGSKLATVWSAPNFCYRCGNVASILEINDQRQKFFNTFVACPDSERVIPTFDILKEIPDYFI
jgi:serine/threonine-protein phosphatase PPG1